jgi:hypothetical protein
VASKTQRKIGGGKKSSKNRFVPTTAKATEPVKHDEATASIAKDDTGGDPEWCGFWNGYGGGGYGPQDF